MSDDWGEDLDLILDAIVWRRGDANHFPVSRDTGNLNKLNALLD